MTNQPKTRAELKAELKVKATDLVNWFSGVVLPPGPIDISPGIRILDPAFHVKVQIDIINANIDDPYRRVLICAYQRLFNLKKYLQNESTRAINSNPANMRATG